MANASRSVSRGLGSMALLALVCAAPSMTVAQTPAQMEYERQQREYWQRQEQQRQEQQRLQQLMNENARRSQEELSRSTGVPLGGQGGDPAAVPQGRSGGAGGAPGAAQAGAAARAAWQKRPALPADRNPLLGRWMRPSSTRPDPSDPFGAARAMLKGGLCEVLFGDGMFEFRSNTLVHIDQRNREEELERVEYRGDGRRVIVIPKVSFNLMEFDVEGPNRINWSSQNCVLVRVGAAPASAAATAAAASAGAGGGTASPSGRDTDTVAAAAAAVSGWETSCSSPMGGGTDVYLARSTIRRTGDRVRMWDMFEFKTPQVISGFRVASVRNQHEYDCRTPRRRMLSTTGFAGHMGNGGAVVSESAPTGWEAVSPGGFVDVCYWKIACGKM